MLRKSSELNNQSGSTANHHLHAVCGYFGHYFDIMYHTAAPRPQLAGSPPPSFCRRAGEMGMVRKSSAGLIDGLPLLWTSKQWRLEPWAGLDFHLGWGDTSDGRGQGWVIGVVYCVAVLSARSS